MLERNLAIWAGNELLTSKRKPVANQQEWMEIWRLSNRHLILTEPGKPEYTGWLQGEIEKRKRDNDGIQDHDHEISADVSKNDKKAVQMKKREYTRSQSSASDWTNSRQKERYYRKWENRTKNGTKMTFAPVQSAGEYEAEMQRILEDGKKLGMKFEDKEEE